MIIISPELLFSQFSHLHISVQFRSPLFLHLHLFVLQEVLQLQTVSSIIVSGAGGSFAITTSYTWQSSFHIQPYSSGSGNYGSSKCANFH